MGPSMGEGPGESPVPTATDVVEVEKVPQFKRLIRPSDVEAVCARQVKCARVVRLGKTVTIEHAPNMAVGGSLSGISGYQVDGLLNKAVRTESGSNCNHLGSLAVDWKGFEVVSGYFSHPRRR